MNRTLSFRELRIDIASKLPEEEEEANNNLGVGASKSGPGRNIPCEDNYMYHM